MDDCRGLLHTGTILKIHETENNSSKPLETVTDIDAYIGNIDENGNLEIGLSVNNEYIFQSLKRLKIITGYNDG